MRDERDDQRYADRKGPYDGCLIVLNVGQDEPELPPAYDLKLREAIAAAYASGWLVLFLFDRGVSLPPHHFDEMEGQDSFLPIGAVGDRKNSDFALLPQQRLEQFALLARNVLKYEDYHFIGNGVRIAGQCSIAGQPVLLPVTDVNVYA